MFKNFKKNHFRDSVRDLFISRKAASIQSLLFGWKPAIFCLRRSYAAEASRYQEISNWFNFYNFQDEKFQPYSLKIVNHAYADGLNKYEAAALIICHFLVVDADEEGDWLTDDTTSEYSIIYSLFEKRPSQLYGTLKTLRDQGDISGEVYLESKQTFEALFTKYPEFKNEEPEEPTQITWWELSYNDSKNNRRRLAGRFLKVSDMVEHIKNKEGGQDLFWRYPFDCQYDDWEPTMPPTNEFTERRMIAIPSRGWDTLWKKYEGHLVGSNFDHWEALKIEARVRPNDKDIIIHKLIRKPYQREMLLDAASA
ncbi:hypothetical protein [Micavibrio aeruginosavorus]|uniref:hypothetical protein n=1 Tax=Micavibrio aeruginosavorus TaxID=349221 RepID=UPI003F4AA439